MGLDLGLGEVLDLIWREDAELYAFDLAELASFARSEPVRDTSMIYIRLLFDSDESWLFRHQIAWKRWDNPSHTISQRSQS